MLGALLEEETFIYWEDRDCFLISEVFLLVGVLCNGWCFCEAGVVSWEVVTSFLH